MRILITEPENYSEIALGVYRTLSNELCFGPLNRAQLAAAIGDYDAVVVRLAHRFDDDILAAATKLRCIVTPTTGLNHIACDIAQGRGITVLSLRGERAFLDTIHATAEHCWGLILALARNIPTAAAHARMGGWDRDLFRGIELSGRTLGIVGFGRLGSRVARYGLSFGMRVIACDSVPVAMPDGVTRADLDTVLRKADIVTLHVPGDTTTEPLIGQTQLKMMKSGSLLINTARGEVIDELALLESLRSGHIAGAALDVLRGENSGVDGWMQSDPLVRYAKEFSNLIITPHIGGATIDSMAKTEIFMAEKFATWVKGGGGNG